MKYPSRREVLQRGLWGAGLVAMGLGVDVRGDDPIRTKQDAVDETGDSPDGTRIYHLMDNSARLNTDDPWFGKAGKGWPAFTTFSRTIIRALDVPICIRQPFPTERGIKDGHVLPLHIDGWVQNQDKPIWREGFLDSMQELQRNHRAILYVGHPGGDTAEKVFNPDGNQVRPWVPSPTLATALQGQGDEFHSAWDEAVGIYDRSGADIAIDAVANIGFNTPYFKAMERWRVKLEQEGRRVFVEAPPDIDERPYLAPYRPAATWTSFVNRVESGRWGGYRLPGLVFVQSDLPMGIEFSGDIGGRSRDWHRLMAARCRRALELGGYPTLSLGPVARAYGDLKLWMSKYAGSRGASG